MPAPAVIRAKALCVLVYQGRILLVVYHDAAKDESFYRLPGGTVEPGERTADAVRREIHEELGSGLHGLRLLTVHENLFTFNDQPAHEIVFVYTAELERRELFTQENISVVESARTYQALWVPLAEALHGPMPLYPALDYSVLLAQ